MNFDTIGTAPPRLLDSRGFSKLVLQHRQGRACAVLAKRSSLSAIVVVPGSICAVDDVKALALEGEFYLSNMLLLKLEMIL